LERREKREGGKETALLRTRLNEREGSWGGRIYMIVRHDRVAALRWNLTLKHTTVLSIFSRLRLISKP